MPGNHLPKSGSSQHQEPLVIDGKIFLANYKPNARDRENVVADWIRYQDKIFISGISIKKIIEKNDLGIFDINNIEESNLTLHKLLEDYLFKQINEEIKNLEDPILAKKKLNNKAMLISYLMKNMHQVNLFHPLYASMCAQVNTSRTHLLPNANLKDSSINLFTWGDKLVIHEQEIIKNLQIRDKDTWELSSYNNTTDTILAANNTQYTINIPPGKEVVAESYTASTICCNMEILNILLKKYRLMQYVDSFIRQNALEEKKQFDLLAKNYPEIAADIQLSPKPKKSLTFFSQSINQSEDSEKIMKYLRMEYPGYAKELADHIDQYTHDEKIFSRALHVLAVLKEPELANEALRKHLEHVPPKPNF